jgi:hypothetical protein
MLVLLFFFFFCLPVVLPDQVNQGYNRMLFFPFSLLFFLDLLANCALSSVDFAEMIVEKVNGEQVWNLKQLLQLIEKHAAEGKDIQIQLKDNWLIVVNPSAAAAAMEGILARHRIPADRSMDLVEQS